MELCFGVKVCWDKVYPFFTPVCASYFIALVTNSNSCWHWDHPRHFSEGTHGWTANLRQQKGPKKYDIPRTVSTSWGRHALAASQPQVKAGSGSGRKPRLSRKSAGMWSEKSPSLRSSFLGCNWSRVTARCLSRHQLLFSPSAVISDLLQIFQIHFNLFTSILSTFIQLSVVTMTPRSVSMWGD